MGSPSGISSFTTYRRDFNTQNFRSNNSTAMILNDWVNRAPQEEKDDRIEARDIINTCIANKDSRLNLSALGLTELPPFSLLDKNELNHICRLDLSRNQLTQIYPNVFERLTNLTVLNLSDNQLGQIDRNAFEGLTNLTVLNLSDNQLGQIDPNAFEGLTNLTVLNLSDNQLGQIDPNAFAGLINLTVLNLSSNRIARIDPYTFAGLTNLTDLNLYYNRLPQIDPYTFAGLINLRWLNLSENQLIVINNNTFEGLTNLTVLLIFNNQLTQIDEDTFAGLPNLELLNLSRNHLPPIDMYTFTGLPEFTRITFLPQTIQSATTTDTLIKQHLQNIYANANMPTPTLLLHKIDIEQLKIVELFFQKLTFNNNHSNSMRKLLTKVISMMNYVLATQNEENNIALTNCFNLMLTYAQNCGDAAGLGLIEVWLTLSKSNNSSTTTDYYNITKTSLILRRLEAFTNSYYPNHSEKIEIMINLLLRVKRDNIVHVDIENDDMQYSNFGNIVTDEQYHALVVSLQEEVNDELIYKEMAKMPVIICRFSDKFGQIEEIRTTRLEDLEADMGGAEVKEDEYNNQVSMIELDCNSAKAELLRKQVGLEDKLTSLVMELDEDNSQTGIEFKELCYEIKTADFYNASVVDARNQEIEHIKMRSLDLTNSINQNYLELKTLITETVQKLQNLVEVHAKDQMILDSLETMSGNAAFSFVTVGRSAARLHNELSGGKDALNIHDNLAKQKVEIESVNNELQQQELQLKQMSEYSEIYNNINTTIQDLIL